MAEKDFDLRIRQPQRTKPVVLLVRSQTSAGSGLEGNATDLVEFGIEFVMQIHGVRNSRY